MKVLIVEDEEPAVKRLVRMLQEIKPELVVQEVIDNVEDAVQWLSKHRNAPPDLIFMDIQLADDNSFEIFKKVDVRSPVIFVTAYDQYALQAFKVNSIDYLLKPIKKEELSLALEKFRKQSSGNQIAQLIDYLAVNTPNTHFVNRFLVQVGQQYKTIPVTDVAYFYTQDKIIFLVAKDSKRYAIDYHLDKLEHLLDPNRFFRINRQYIISIDSIDKMTTYPKSRVRLELTPPAQDETVTSTERSSDFKKWLAGQQP